MTNLMSMLAWIKFYESIDTLSSIMNDYQLGSPKGRSASKTALIRYEPAHSLLNIHAGHLLMYISRSQNLFTDIGINGSTIFRTVHLVRHLPLLLAGNSSDPIYNAVTADKGLWQLGGFFTFHHSKLVEHSLIRDNQRFTLTQILQITKKFESHSIELDAPGVTRWLEMSLEASEFLMGVYAYDTDDSNVSRYVTNHVMFILCQSMTSYVGMPFQTLSIRRLFLATLNYIYREPKEPMLPDFARLLMNVEDFSGRGKIYPRANIGESMFATLELARPSLEFAEELPGESRGDESD